MPSHAADFDFLDTDLRPSEKRPSCFFSKRASIARRPGSSGVEQGLEHFTQWIVNTSGTARAHVANQLANVLVFNSFGTNQYPYLTLSHLRLGNLYGPLCEDVQFSAERVFESVYETVSPSYALKILDVLSSPAAYWHGHIESNAPAHEAAATGVQNDSAIRLLQSWLADDSSDAEQAKDLEEMKRGLDANRLSDRKLFT